LLFWCALQLSHFMHVSCLLLWRLGVHASTSQACQ
jgi:hypothetical protein